MLIVGEKKEESNTISVREHGQGDKGASSLEDFIKMFQEKIKK